MRTALGFGVGTLLLGIAWRLGERYRAFSSLLAGGGCAVYYVTTAIAFHYYQLFSQSVAFGIMVVVTLFYGLDGSALRTSRIGRNGHSGRLSRTIPHRNGYAQLPFLIRIYGYFRFWAASTFRGERVGTSCL